MTGLRRTWIGVVALLAVLGCVGAARGVVITFEDIPAGSGWGTGESFTASGVTIGVEPFKPNYAVGTGKPGQALVADGSMAGASGNALGLQNATAVFGLSQPIAGMALQYMNLSGAAVILTINGERERVKDLASLNGQTIGGVQVSATATPHMIAGVPLSFETGSVFLVGPVTSLAIGGKALAIDNLIASYTVPEPATLGLLALTMVYFVRRRL